MDTQNARLNPTLWSNRDTSPITIWLGQAKNGDEVAKQRLYDAAYEHLLALTARMLSRWGFARKLQASEAVNEVLYSGVDTALRSISFTNREHFARVVVNHVRFFCHRFLEKNNRMTNLQSIKDGDGIQDRNQPMPDEVMAKAETELRLIESIDGLDEHLQKVFIMAYQGMSLSEIAIEIGESKTNVFKKLSRAKIQLQEKLIAN